MSELEQIMYKYSKSSRAIAVNLLSEFRLKRFKEKDFIISRLERIIEHLDINLTEFKEELKADDK